MKLSKIYVKNYRNFVDNIINLNKETVVIGPNDVGKTNLLMAIRLVLDKSLSYLDLEPQEKDFNIFADSDEIVITLEFSNISEETDSYIYASLGHYIEDGNLYIMYKGYKDGDEKFDFYISAHNEEASFVKIPSRNTYINYINCVYLDSTRQLKQFLKKSKTNMIKSYKSNRTQDEITGDESLIDKIGSQVSELNSNIENISYINKSTSFIKEELQSMSSHNDNFDIKFSSYNDPDDIMDNVELISQIDGKNVNIGGDGRSNQIYMSMWIKEMNEKYDEKKQFVVFLLEEPESHLHFPLQSMTIRQIIKKITSQFIVTSHSPQVVMEFNPYSIVRLYFDKNKKTLIANEGCSQELEDCMVEFGYRYNLITGSMFYSSGVFLVEGISELLLFKYILTKLGIDIEKYNIMVISVEGVGFKPYIKLLNKLSIPYTIRTDNDIYASSNGKYYCYGINRLIDCFNEVNTLENQLSKDVFSELESNELSEIQKECFDNTLVKLNNSGLFLSSKDLENDLAATDFIKDYIIEKYDSVDKFISKLQASKANNMYHLIDELKNRDINVNDNNIGTFKNPINWLMNKVSE